MSVEHLAVVLHHSRSKGTAKLVLIGIANHEGDGGSWPSHATLAKYANVDVSSVRKAIRQLRSRGEVRVFVQDGGDRDCPDELRPNRYQVLVSCPAWCDRTPQHRDTRKLSGRQTALALGPLGVPAQGGWAKTPTPPWAPAPTKPPTQTSPLEVVPQPQTARAWPPAPCVDCGQDEHTCQARQRKWPAEDRHPYQPPRHATG